MHINWRQNGRKIKKVLLQHPSQCIAHLRRQKQKRKKNEEIQHPDKRLMPYPELKEAEKKFQRPIRRIAPTVVPSSENFQILTWRSFWFYKSPTCINGFLNLILRVVQLFWRQHQVIQFFISPYLLYYAKYLCNHYYDYERLRTLFFGVVVDMNIIIC